MYCRHKALATMYLQASGNYHSVMRKGLKNGTICIIVMVPLGNTNSLHRTSEEQYLFVNKILQITILLSLSTREMSCNFPLFFPLL